MTAAQQNQTRASPTLCAAQGEASRFRGRLTIALVVSLLLLLTGQAAAQNDPGEEVRYRLRTSVELVLVPVTAKDKNGELVTDLTREDFQLFEDGIEQSIRYFSVDPFPLSVVILVDAGLSRGQREGVHQALPTLAHAFAPSDEFSLYLFDTYPRQTLEFTRDAEKLRLALQSLPGSPVAPAAGRAPGGPMTSGPRINNAPVGPRAPSTLPQASKPVKTIHDALFAAGMALRDREGGRRRIIFIVSDGINSRLNVHSFEETRDLLLAHRITVYAVGVGNARFALGTTVLSDYAGATGGDFYAPMKPTGLARAYARIAEQARYQYTLVYAAQPAPGSREYRRIQVRVRRPGVTLLARDGYFAGVPKH